VTAMPVALREVAEYPNCFGPIGPDDERIETDRYTLCLGAAKTSSTVQRQRFAEAEVDEVLAEVRGLLRERGRSRTQWEVGSAARPPNLVALLRRRGLADDHDPYAVALVLTRPPPPGPPGIVARRVASLEEYVAASEVQWIAFGMAEAERDEARAHLERAWGGSPALMHAAWLDGEIVAAGTCVPTEHGLLLYGGATLPRARGRGAYRALLGARWEAAVRRATPALLTQGGAMSRRILERVGFEAVGHVHALVDDFG